MMRCACWTQLCLLLVLALQGAPVTAKSVQELQAADQLQIGSSLAPQGLLVPGQKATLTLTLATQRWFTGGTRISIPEVPGLVILQTEQFASNASENRGGQSWVVQRWHLDVYPQQTGEFRIPPIRLQVKVNDAEAGDVQGELFSPALQLTASIPQGLAQAEHWVASPSFQVSESFDRTLQDLQVGDAFEREVLFEAADVMAMMLPTFTPADTPGLAAYPAPPVLENNSNRGQTTARRVQRVSYVVEAEGEYTLPALEFFWWDTQTAELQLLSLPATVITVGSGAPAQARSERQFEPQSLLLPALGLLLLVALAWLARKWLPRLPLARTEVVLESLWQQLRELRKPALPSRLNPDGNAGD